MAKFSVSDIEKNKQYIENLKRNREKQLRKEIQVRSDILDFEENDITTIETSEEYKEDEEKIREIYLKLGITKLPEKTEGEVWLDLVSKFQKEKIISKATVDKINKIIYGDNYLKIPYHAFMGYRPSVNKSIANLQFGIIDMITKALKKEEYFIYKPSAPTSRITKEEILQNRNEVVSFNNSIKSIIDSLVKMRLFGDRYIKYMPNKDRNSIEQIDILNNLNTYLDSITDKLEIKENEVRYIRPIIKTKIKKKTISSNTVEDIITHMKCSKEEFDEIIRDYKNIEPEQLNWELFNPKVEEISDKIVLEKDEEDTKPSTLHNRPKIVSSEIPGIELFLEQLHKGNIDLDDIFKITENDLYYKSDRNRTILDKEFKLPKTIIKLLNSGALDRNMLIYLNDITTEEGIKYIYEKNRELELNKNPRLKESISIDDFNPGTSGDIFGYSDVIKPISSVDRSVLDNTSLDGTVLVDKSTNRKLNLESDKSDKKIIYNKPPKREKIKVSIPKNNIKLGVDEVLIKQEENEKERVKKMREEYISRVRSRELENKIRKQNNQIDTKDPIQTSIAKGRAKSSPVTRQISGDRGSSDDGGGSENNQEDTNSDGDMNITGNSLDKDEKDEYILSEKSEDNINEDELDVILGEISGEDLIWETSDESSNNKLKSDEEKLEINEISADKESNLDIKEVGVEEYNKINSESGDYNMNSELGDVSFDEFNFDEMEIDLDSYNEEDLAEEVLKEKEKLHEKENLKEKKIKSPGIDIDIDAINDSDFSSVESEDLNSESDDNSDENSDIVDSKFGIESTFIEDDYVEEDSESDVEKDIADNKSDWNLEDSINELDLDRKDKDEDIIKIPEISKASEKYYKAEGTGNEKIGNLIESLISEVEEDFSDLTLPDMDTDINESEIDEKLIEAGFKLENKNNESEGSITEQKGQDEEQVCDTSEEQEESEETVEEQEEPVEEQEEDINDIDEPLKEVETDKEVEEANKKHQDSLNKEEIIDEVLDRLACILNNKTSDGEVQIDKLLKSKEPFSGLVNINETVLMDAPEDKLKELKELNQQMSEENVLLQRFNDSRAISDGVELKTDKNFDFEVNSVEDLENYLNNTNTTQEKEYNKEELKNMMLDDFSDINIPLEKVSKDTKDLAYIRQSIDNMLLNSWKIELGKQFNFVPSENVINALDELGLITEVLDENTCNVYFKKMDVKYIDRRYEYQDFILELKEAVKQLTRTAMKQTVPIVNKNLIPRITNEEIELMVKTLTNFKLEISEGNLIIDFNL